MISGLLGRKIGMTQIFDRDGNTVSVTVVEAGPCTVLEVKETPKKIKLGFESVKESKVNKPATGFFKKIGLAPMKTIREFRSTDNASYTIGQEIKADFFKAGDFVDVVGTSIGKGFQGGMKIHHWKGGPAGHGSMHHRRRGSNGPSTDPGRVLLGMNMPRHMGDDRVTTQGLRVMNVDVENNLILLKGSVPGGKNALVEINRSFKKAFKALDEERVVVEKKVNPMKQSKKGGAAAKPAAPKKK